MDARPQTRLHDSGEKVSGAHNVILNRRKRRIEGRPNVRIACEMKNHIRLHFVEHI